MNPFVVVKFRVNIAQPMPSWFILFGHRLFRADCVRKEEAGKTLYRIFGGDYTVTAIAVLYTSYRLWFENLVIHSLVSVPFREGGGWLVEQTNAGSMPTVYETYTQAFSALPPSPKPCPPVYVRNRGPENVAYISPARAAFLRERGLVI